MFIQEIKLILFSSLFLITACQSDGNSTSATHEKIKKNIRKDVTTIMKDDLTPGMSVALINKDKIVFAEGFGVANTDTQLAVTADTSFWLASISKTAIAVSIMHAKERGLLSLDLDVYDLIKNQTDLSLSKPFEEPILLKHLVNHTSSIIDYDDTYNCVYFVGDENGEHYNLLNRFIDPNSCDETVAVSLEGYLEAYLSEGQAYYSEQNNFLQAKPGSQYQYSNIGAALAGYTFKVATGIPLAEYTKTNIFEPLQMNNTSWQLSDLNQYNIATPYKWDESKQSLNPVPLYSSSTWPDGGLRSSANDLAKYLLMVMNNGEIDNTRILSSSSIKEMIPTDYGEIGVFWYSAPLSFKGKRIRNLIGHDGEEIGAYTFMYYDPAKSVGIVLLANGDGYIAGVDKEAWTQRHYLLIDKLLGYAEKIYKN